MEFWKIWKSEKYQYSNVFNFFWVEKIIPEDVENLKILKKRINSQKCKDFLRPPQLFRIPREQWSLAPRSPEPSGIITWSSSIIGHLIPSFFSLFSCHKMYERDSKKSEKERKEQDQITFLSLSFSTFCRLFSVRKGLTYGWKNSEKTGKKLGKWD